MDNEIELHLARLSGQLSAQKLILVSLLARAAASSGADAEEYIMTITAPLTSVPGEDEGDIPSRLAMLSFANMAEEIEALALERLDL